MSGGKTKYPYDVAFSFLAKDEARATSVSDRLNDRFKTFVYSEQQKILAGRDGEEAFAKVFSREALIVVIFHREEWGTTTWTRIEQDAIRNRAHEEGYDFTIFVPLDAKPKMPAWLPKNRLWANIERWGETGLAAVIETRIQELGGAVKPETLQMRKERMDREIAHNSLREEFINGYQLPLAEKGYASALIVSDELTAWANKSGVNASRNGTHAVLLTCPRIHSRAGTTSLRLRWTQQHRNRIGPNARIFAEVFDGIPEWPGYYPLDEAVELNSLWFRPDITSDGLVCWFKEDNDVQLSPETVAENIANFFMDTVVAQSEPIR